eukprot:jgi/Picsp_1/140/NSC_00140-R1_protein
MCRSGSEEKPSPQQTERQLLIDLIVQYPATRGTIAVLLGYLANIEPLGSFQWDRYDALLGILFALPIIAIDALIMVPDWEPPKLEKKMNLVVPRTVADTMKDVTVKEDTGTTTYGLLEEQKDVCTEKESTSVAVQVLDKDEPELVRVEKLITVRGEQSPWKDALRRAQLDRTMNNAGQLLSPPAEALLLVLVHASEEMLYRGVALTFAVQWTTDRLYEAFGEGSILLSNSIELPVSAAGSLVASGTLVITAVYLLLSKDLSTLKAIERLENIDKTKSQKDDLRKTLMGIQDSIIRQQKWTLAITASSEIVQWVSASASYLITGNILAPIAGALASDALCSMWQRKKIKTIQARLVEESQERLAKSKERTVLVNAIKQDREIKKRKEQKEDD